MMELYILLLIWLVYILLLLQCRQWGSFHIHHSVSVRYLLTRIEFISYSCRIFIANISICKWVPVVTCGFDCLFLLWYLPTSLWTISPHILLYLTLGKIIFKQSGAHAQLPGRHWAGTHFDRPRFIGAQIRSGVSWFQW